MGCGRGRRLNTAIDEYSVAMYFVRPSGVSFPESLDRFCWGEPHLGLLLAVCLTAVGSAHAAASTVFRSFPCPRVQGVSLVTYESVPVVTRQCAWL